MSDFAYMCHLAMTVSPAEKHDAHVDFNIWDILSDAPMRYWILLIKVRKIWIFLCYINREDVLLCQKLRGALIREGGIIRLNMVYKKL